jgi:hypothetical protein
VARFTPKSGAVAVDAGLEPGLAFPGCRLTALRSTLTVPFVMRSLFALVSLACIVTAIAAKPPFLLNGEHDVQHVSHAGFDLDLNSFRLVQLEDQPPVWMTELDKVPLLCLSSILSL